MNFHRSMKKLKNNMLSLFLAIAVSLTTLSYTTAPLLIHADNAGGGGSGGGTAENVGGASDSRCGYRMYVVDKNGNLLSRVVDLVSQAPTTNKAGLSTRVGGGNTSELLLMPSDMPKPFKHNGICFMGNGMQTKAWMRSKGDNGKQHIMNIIATYLGADVAEQFEDLSEEKFCVLEPIAWHNIYLGNKSTTNTGFGYYGSFYNWMQAYAEMGLADGGFTKQLDNRILGRCLTLERDQPNLGLMRPTYSGLLDLATVGNEGFGIQLYSNLEKAMQTTCDEPLQPNPHQAPPESQGKTQIVKNYRTLLPDNTYTEDGCFKTEKVSNKIIIEEEEEYKVVGWVTSNATTYPIASINWNPPGVHIQEGKTSGDTVTLQPKTEKTLYVLLEKKETEPEDLEKANYTITQSQITRGIRLSKPDAWLSMEKIQEFEFTWKSPKHKTECDGHEYKTGKKVPELDPNTGDETGNLIDETDTAYCTWGKWVDQDVIFALDNSEKMNAPIRCYFFA